MASNMFISLDPFVYSSYNWNEVFFMFPVVFSMIMVPFSFFSSNSSIQMGLVAFTKNALGVVSQTKSVQLKGSAHIICSLFFFVMAVNLVGMLPFSFSFTSSLSLVSVMSFPLWFSLVISGWSKSLKKSAASMVPFGAPVGLSFFLCILELISLLVRPISLTLRLVANMMAGHCFLSVLSQFVIYFCFSSVFSGGFMFFVFFLYLVFEVCISLVQAYIFFSLISLYSNDHPE